MQSNPLEFRFKGDRDYIHGTDMFNALVGVHPAKILREVHFSIHGFVRTPHCEVYQTDLKETVATLEHIKVRASFDLGGVAQWVVLKESSLAPSSPVKRYEYPEDRISSLCDIQDYSVALNRESPFTFIETVVSMNKHMHEKLFANAMGKWIFTGIDLRDGCDARKGLALRLGRDVTFRLTRAEIVHNGQAIGNLFFSLVKQ
jgi:hypothetical protein